MQTALRPERLDRRKRAAPHLALGRTTGSTTASPGKSYLRGAGPVAPARRGRELGVEDPGVGERPEGHSRALAAETSSLPTTEALTTRWGGGGLRGSAERRVRAKMAELAVVGQRFPGGALCTYSFCPGPLAHREEQGTFNPKVPGSRPGRPTFRRPRGIRITTKDRRPGAAAGATLSSRLPGLANRAVSGAGQSVDPCHLPVEHP
jgi:hypothetical protein